jgi:hypothetical protein
VFCRRPSDTKGCFALSLHKSDADTDCAAAKSRLSLHHSDLNPQPLNDLQWQTKGAESPNHKNSGRD